MNECFGAVILEHTIVATISIISDLEESGNNLLSPFQRTGTHHHSSTKAKRARSHLLGEEGGEIPRTTNLRNNDPLRQCRQSTSLIPRRTLPGAVIAIEFPTFRRTVVAIRAINALY